MAMSFKEKVQHVGMFFARHSGTYWQWLAATGHIIGSCMIILAVLRYFVDVFKVADGLEGVNSYYKSINITQLMLNSGTNSPTVPRLDVHFFMIVGVATVLTQLCSLGAVWRTICYCNDAVIATIPADLDDKLVNTLVVDTLFSLTNGLAAVILTEAFTYYNFQVVVKSLACGPYEAIEIFHKKTEEPLITMAKPYWTFGLPAMPY